MKTNKIKAPTKMVIAICEKEPGEAIEKYLDKEGIQTGLTLLGKGTAVSEIADIFGFGLSSRNIICAVVPVSRLDTVVAGINAISRIEDDAYGLTMVLPMNSADSTLLEMLKLL